MAFYEAYFDESGCDDGSKILAVGGYLFDSDRARRASRRWQRALSDFELPYFHMVDCAPGNHPFDKLSKGQRINLEKRLIEIIKRYSITGFVSIVNPSRYKDNQNTDAYSACVNMCALAVTSLIEQRDPTGKVSLFFEAGHENGTKANRILDQLGKAGSGFSEVYASHTFAKKGDVRLLEAADLLVWQYAKFIKDKLWSNRKPRADFASLVQHKHDALFMTNVDRTGLMFTDDNPAQMENHHRDKVITAFFSDDDTAMSRLIARATDPDQLSAIQESKTGKVFLANINWSDL